jgi:hypothetical protein
MLPSLYVGDEVRDIQAAHKAGVAVAAVTWGFNSRDLLARHARTTWPMPLTILLSSSPRPDPDRRQGLLCVGASRE